ncbi:MAG: hypothetical protein HC809_01695 [Gammaproteobacteria bacterium]|nr:hypothetical protein [Gammaproteobacteria bacterium]
MVLDTANGVTDALVRCAACGASYLLETLNLGEGATPRRFRLCVVDERIAAGFRHDVARGSCDVSRAGAQRRFIEEQSQLTSLVLELDAGSMTLCSVASVDDDTDIATGSWRDQRRSSTRTV